MGLSEISYDNAQPIEAYGPDFFRIGGVVIEGAALITPWTASEWQGVADLAPLLALEGKIDVLLLGTGKSLTYPPAALRQALEECGIGVEPMASPTACRTYNVLLSEGRRIAVALLPVGED